MARTFGQKNQGEVVERTSFGARQERYRSHPNSQPQSAIHAELTSQLNATSASEDPVNQEKEGGRIKSYFFACVAGFTFSIIAMGLIDGASAPGGFGSQFFLNIVSSIVMLTLAPFLLIPARILADVMRAIQVPRGCSDILIGIVLGSVMFLPEVSTGEAIKWQKLAFVIGGGIGGFAYWRSRGYPGLKRKYNKAAELADFGLKRM